MAGVHRIAGAVEPKADKLQQRLDGLISYRGSSRPGLGERTREQLCRPSPTRLDEGLRRGMTNAVRPCAARGSMSTAMPPPTPQSAQQRRPSEALLRAQLKPMVALRGDEVAGQPIRAASGRRSPHGRR